MKLLFSLNYQNNKNINNKMKFSVIVAGLMLSEISAVHINQADSNLASTNQYASMKEDELSALAKTKKGDPLLEAAIADRIYARMALGGYVGYYGYYGGFYGWGWPAYYPGWTTHVYHVGDPYPAVWTYYPHDVVDEIISLKAYHETAKEVAGYVASETVKKITDTVLGK